ncbi:MAG: DUF4838 domain-containing protein [Clostridia bacterium]|nr:DUF4838 domain-containing protein [Clostridia bacterium]
MKIKRLTAWLLLAACTCATACVSDKKDSSDGAATNTPVTGVVTESNVHYVEGTLHDVNVDFNAPVSDFAVNGKTDYKVVSGDSTKGMATGFIAQHIGKGTGAPISTLYLADLTENVDENTQYIFVGCEDLFTQLGGEIPTYEKIGEAGYQIETVGKNVFINAYSVNGYQMGAIAFLREVLGYDMLGENCVIYEKDGKVMPAMDIVERPDFDLRIAPAASVVSTELYGMGYTYTGWIIRTGSTEMHNWNDFVSLEEADEHPDWASNDSTRWQGCWTTRGNKESYQGLIDHITEKIKGFLKANPLLDSICIGQNDVGTNTPQVENCKCKACQASYEYYGDTMAGAWLSLCNRISLKVDEWLESEEAISYFGKVKDFNLLQLVYHTSQRPPVETDGSGDYLLDENGKGIPKEEMWFNADGSMEDWDTAWTDENGESMEDETSAKWTEDTDRIYAAPSIKFWWAASSMDYTHSMYEEQNAFFKKMTDGWAGLGGEFYIWMYCLNSEGILYPYNSFDSSFETVRYYKSIGSKSAFWQGQFENQSNSGFTKLRNYLDSKVEFNVNSDYQYYVDKFFKYYYGVGGEYMQSYFEQVVAQCRYIEQEYSVGGGIHNQKLLNKENWPEGLINTWLALMDKAYDAVEQEYKLTDPDQYEIYKNHITIESLFPRYVLCTSYESSYEASDLKTMRQEFLDDFYALGNKVYAEGRIMSNVSDLWDLD